MDLFHIFKTCKKSIHASEIVVEINGRQRFAL